jgi:hypothetical protein
VIFSQVFFLSKEKRLLQGRNRLPGLFSLGLLTADLSDLLGSSFTRDCLTFAGTWEILVIRGEVIRRNHIVGRIAVETAAGLDVAAWSQYPSAAVQLSIRRASSIGVHCRIVVAGFCWLDTTAEKQSNC